MSAPIHKVNDGQPHLSSHGATAMHVAIFRVVPEILSNLDLPTLSGYGTLYAMYIAVRDERWKEKTDLEPRAICIR
jgi:hypothetical protein